MINEALVLIRKFHALKSVDLAQRLGISTSYLSEIENGKKQPSLELIAKYSEIFDISKSAILFFSEELEKDNVTFKKAKINIRKYMMKFLRVVEKFSELD